MSFFLDWFTTHIAGVIQTLAGLIICIIIVFTYRLFFVKSAKNLSIDGSESNPTLEFIEEKLNKLLIQQSALKVTATSLAAAGDLPQEQVGDISKLKDLLKQKENEILNLKKTTSAQAVNASTVSSESAADNAAKVEAAQQAQAQSLADLKKLNDQLSLYQTQIDDLKSRLSDYEIIAEDIADLQKFKKENELLKNQLSVAGVVAELPADPQTQTTEKPVLTEDEKTLHLADDSAAEQDISKLLAQAEAGVRPVTEEAPIVTEPVKSAAKAPVPVEPSAKQSEIDALFAEFSPDSPIAPAAKEATADSISEAEDGVDTTLTDNEKNLIDDFSKTQKG